MVDGNGRQVVSATMEGGTHYNTQESQLNVIQEEADKVDAFSKRMLERAKKEEEEQKQVFTSPKLEEASKPLSTEIKTIENKIEKEKIRINDIGRTFSFITEQEELEAKNLIEDELGFELPRVTGWMLAVKIWTRPEDMHTFVDEEGNKKSLIIPIASLNEDKYRSCTGLVLGIGPDAYKYGPRFEEPLYMRVLRFIFRMPRKPWCKVGDWIVFPRNEGTQVSYRGVSMMYVPDDKVMQIVSDPSHVTRE